MSIPFIKYHGAGNDYIVIDGRDRSNDWSELAKAICSLHIGAGADGIALVAPSNIAPVRLRIFNPDGSEAEMSGNGIRCFSKFVLEQKIADANDDELQVETGNGILTVTPYWENGRVKKAKVSMGEPELRWKQIPINTYEASVRDNRDLDETLLESLGLRFDYIFFEGRLLNTEDHTVQVTGVSVGNPHAVQFLHDPIENFPLDKVGPLVEWNPAFPKQVNYHIVNLYDRGALGMRSWERGAGETLACGTGACASVVAARLHNYVDDTVKVHIPGGELTVTWNGHGPVYLEGPIEEVFSGAWPE